MKIPKVVLDTNVFISSILLKGPSSAIIEKWKEDLFILLFSADIFDEYFEVIARPKFDQEETAIRELATLITEKGVAIETKTKINIIKDDPDDNKFLECAVDGEANFIVSGDKHLLDIKKYHHIKILSINQFIKEIG